MASNWISDPQFDAQGRPYVQALADGPGMKKGEVRYISPAEVTPYNDYGADPRLASWAQGNGQPGQSLLQNRGRWNPRTGKWDQDVNWTNLANIGVGGLIAAPLVAGALGPGAAAPLTNTATSAGFTGAAPTVGTGAGALGTGASVAIPTTAATALPAATAIPAAAADALPLGFTQAVHVTAPALTHGLTAAQMAAVTGAGAAPTVATLMNANAADPVNNRPPIDPLNSSSTTARPTTAPTVSQTGPVGNPSNPISTNSFNLPWGLTGKDLIGYTGNFVNDLLNRNAAGDYNEARAAADKAALDFAMRAYDEQNAKEQARWDATEQRRVPYRAASVRTLEEFRRLLGIEN